MVRRMNNVYGRAIALAAAGSFSLAPLVTDRFGLASAGPAFGIAAKRKGLKVVIEPAV
jgi:L-iditol 2-dehydrogenase